jgi:hypothetical protein
MDGLYEMYTTENEFARIEQCIREAISKAIKAGVNPTEIWLGEVEMATFRKHIKLQFINHRKASEQISEENFKYADMEVRESKSQGIRVGVSWVSNTKA